MRTRKTRGRLMNDLTKERSDNKMGPSELRDSEDKRR